MGNLATKDDDCMLISVIVPVYKVEPYLRKCVDSVLGQTFRDFELILVDDGSPDNCGKICDEYAARDARVKVIHQANGGLSAARNAGIDWAMSNSKSDYITFLDSDDWIEPFCLEELYRGVQLSGTVSCASCRVGASPKQVSRIDPKRCRWKCLSPEEYWLLPNGIPQTACAKMYRKTLFSDVRFPIGKLHEDDFTTHLLLFPCRQIAVCDLFVYNYCIRPGSITTAAWSPRRLDAVEALRLRRDYFVRHGFGRAAEATRGRMLATMAGALRFLKERNLPLADEYERFVRDEMKREPPAFWVNRDLYRALNAGLWFWMRWGFFMLGDAVRSGRRSWLMINLLGR